MWTLWPMFTAPILLFRSTPTSSRWLSVSCKETRLMCGGCNGWQQVVGLHPHPVRSFNVCWCFLVQVLAISCFSNYSGRRLVLTGSRHPHSDVSLSIATYPLDLTKTRLQIQGEIASTKGENVITQHDHWYVWYAFLMHLFYCRYHTGVW